VSLKRRFSLHAYYVKNGFIFGIIAGLVYVTFEALFSDLNFSDTTYLIIRGKINGALIGIAIGILVTLLISGQILDMIEISEDLIFLMRTNSFPGENNRSSRFSVLKIKRRKSWTYLKS
jgi:hypothetical protein